MPFCFPVPRVLSLTPSRKVPDCGWSCLPDFVRLKQKKTAPKQCLSIKFFLNTNWTGKGKLFEEALMICPSWQQNLIALMTKLSQGPTLPYGILWTAIRHMTSCNWSPSLREEERTLGSKEEIANAKGEEMLLVTSSPCPSSYSVESRGNSKSYKSVSTTIGSNVVI